MPMGMDKTIGAPVVPGERQLVVITVADGVHAQLSQGQSISREGRLPPLYARSSRRCTGITDWKESPTVR